MEQDFDELVRQADEQPIDTWDFTWLEGRAVEERPSWRYFDQVAARAATVPTMLEVQAGVGAMIGTLPVVPALAVATEGFGPSIDVAGPRLRAGDAHLVVTANEVPALPFADEAFELVVSRHPVEPWWDEIARVLRPGGTYFAQHVGPHSLRELSEVFLGPVPDASRRDPALERQAAERSGLAVRDLRLERPRTAFFDIGAVTYFNRLVPWIVPGFSVDRYRTRLRSLHELIEAEGAFETTSSRMLIEAVKP